MPDLKLEPGVVARYEVGVAVFHFTKLVIEHLSSSKIVRNTVTRTKFDGTFIRFIKLKYTLRISKAHGLI